MRSNVINFSKENNTIKDILQEAEKVAVYSGLQEKEVLNLRLLTEEMCSMADVLVQDFDGEFWIDNRKGDFSLCISLNVDTMNMELKEKLLNTSTTGKNASAKGFVGWIRNLVENFALSSEQNISCMYGYGADYENMMYSSSWIYSQYRMEAQNSGKNETWDELEKSILAKLADEVIVGVKGKKIEIVVRKKF